MQEAKNFFANLIRILNFLMAVLSFLMVARASLAGERKTPEVETKEITIGHAAPMPLYAAGAVLSLAGFVLLAVYLWRLYKGK